MKVLTLLVVLSVSLTLVALEAPLPQEQQEQLMFEGVLTAFDAESKTLSVKTAEEKEMQFGFTDDTKVVTGSESNEALAPAMLKEKVGARLKVSYKLDEGKAHAIRIELPANPN